MKNPNESNSEVKIFGVSLNLQVIVGVVLLVVGIGVGLLVGKMGNRTISNTTTSSAKQAAKAATTGDGKAEVEPQQEAPLASEPALKSDDPIRDGKDAFEKQDYALALKYFDLALANAATKPEGYHWRGIVYASSQLPETAIKDYDQALTLSPDSVPFHLDRAFAFYAYRDYENAIEDYDAILKIEPSNVDALLGRALANNAQKMFEAALNDLNKLNSSSSSTKSLQLQGDVNIGLRRFADALKCYDAALQLKPNDFELRARKARVYLMSGQTKKAISAFDVLDKERPFRGDVGNDLGYALICGRRYYDAVENLDAAKQWWASKALSENIAFASTKLIEESLQKVRKKRDVARSYTEAAYGFLNLEDLDSAEKYAARSVQLNSRDPFCWFILGSCQQERNDCESAFQSFEKAVKLAPKYTSAMFHVAMCATQLEKPELAIEKYKEFLRLEKDTAAYTNMAHNYMRIDKFEEADSALTAALAIDPNCTPAMRFRAYILEKRNDYTGALGWLNRALSHAPEDGHIYQSRALSYFQQNECGLALQDVRKALTLDPSLRNAQYALEMILIADGTPEELIKQAKIGATKWPPSHRDFLFAASVFPWYAYTWAGDTAEANRWLEDGLKRQTRGTKWPYALVDYLAGRKTAEELLAAADDSGERTEAHSWIGMVLLQKGEKEKAIEEFKWVSQNGAPTFLETSLAKAMLRRTTAPPNPSIVTDIKDSSNPK